MAEAGGGVGFRARWKQVDDHLPLYTSFKVTCSVMSDDPMDYCPPGSSVHGILQARILEWVAIPFSRGSSQLRDRTWVSCIAGRFFTISTTRETIYTTSKVKSESPSVVSDSLNPMDYTVHGILQARIPLPNLPLDRVASSYRILPSRGTLSPLVF